MSTQTLRGLAKDYSTGALDKETYRKLRSELIKGIVAGEIAVKAIDYLPPITPDKEEAADTIQRDRSKTDWTEIRPEQPAVSSKTSTQVKQKTVPKNENKSPWLFISVSAFIVILLIVVVVLFYPAPPEATTKTIVETTETETTTAIEDNNTSKAGEDLIANFLTEKNWSEDSMNNFVAAWASLTQAERDTAAETKRMQRMRASIYKQFLEEKALASIDSDAAIMKQQKLIDFANAIGINDSRLVLE